MTSSVTYKQRAGQLLSAIGEVLDAYLVLDNRLFSWKNAFGWNNVEPLKAEIPPLVERVTAIAAQIQQIQTELAEVSPEQLPDAQTLIQFFKLFASYSEALKFAIQGMGRVLVHIETKRNNRAEFKQVRYESDLMIYKSQVDKYQLYGEQLNALIRQL